MTPLHYVILGGVYDGVMDRKTFENRLERVTVTPEGGRVVLRAPWWYGACPEGQRTYHLDGNVAEWWPARIARLAEPVQNATEGTAFAPGCDVGEMLDRLAETSAEVSYTQDREEVEDFLAGVFRGPYPR